MQAVQMEAAETLLNELEQFGKRSHHASQKYNQYKDLEVGNTVLKPL